MKSSNILLKVIAVVGVLTLIVAIAIYMNLSKAASDGNLAAALEDAILTGKAKAYTLDTCAKPVVPGTLMTDTQLRFYFAYHITRTTFTSGPPNYTPTWYTCPVFNYVRDFMNKKRIHADLMTMVTTQEANGCDVPNVSDAPAKYCGYSRS